MEHLTEKEKELLSQFIQNEQLSEAVRRTITDGIFYQGTPQDQKRNWVFGMDPKGELSNEQYGEAVRTQAQAYFLLERSFVNMKTMLEKPEKKDKKNKAR